MVLDVFIGAAPFEWKHIGITYVYGLVCELFSSSPLARVLALFGQNLSVCILLLYLSFRLGSAGKGLFQKTILGYFFEYRGCYVVSVA